MSNSQIRDIIVDALGRKFDVKPQEVENSSTFDAVGADSIFLVELAMDLEQKLSVSVPDDLLRSDQTIGDAIAVIDGLVTAA